MNNTIETIPGTNIPITPSNLYVNGRGGPSVWNDRMSRKVRLNKILDSERPGGPIEYPESGGVFVYHKTFPYPEKGHRDDFNVQAAQLAKRVLISWVRFFSYSPTIRAGLGFFLLPWKYKIRIVERWLREYCNIADLFLSEYYFQDRYYNAMCRELRKGIIVFLSDIGVSSETSERFALAFVTLIQYDTAYYYILVDLFSETTAEKMRDDPRGQIRHLAGLLADRDGRANMLVRFESFETLIRILLLIPRVRRSFRIAVDVMQFELLQYDEADRYHMRNKPGYKWFGMTYEQRLAKWPLEPHLYQKTEYGQP